jgi:hypothetical protein
MVVPHAFRQIHVQDLSDSFSPHAGITIVNPAEALRRIEATQA